MYEYKGYNPNNAKHVIKYTKEHYKRIPLNVDKDFFENELKPEADRVGLPISTWIKEAIKEKLERDKP